MQRHYSSFLRTKLSREIQTESPSTVLLNTPAGRSICGSRRISKTMREKVVVIVGPLDFREPRVTFKSHFSCRKPILWLVEFGGNNMQQMLPIPNYLQPSLLTARWTTVFPWSVVFDSTVRSSSFAVSYVDVVYKKMLTSQRQYSRETYLQWKTFRPITSDMQQSRAPLLSKFVAQNAFWHPELPNFWRVEQLN